MQAFISEHNKKPGKRQFRAADLGWSVALCFSTIIILGLFESLGTHVLQHQQAGLKSWQSLHPVLTWLTHWGCQWQTSQHKSRKQNVGDKEVGSEGCVGALQAGSQALSWPSIPPKCLYKVKQYTFTFPWLHELRKRRSFSWPPRWSMTTYSSVTIHVTLKI